MKTSAIWQRSHSVVGCLKTEVQKESQPYLSFRDEIELIDGIAIKERRIAIPVSLQDKTINQLHINDMDMEKTRMLVQELIHWMNMNVNME